METSERWPDLLSVVFYKIFSTENTRFKAEESMRSVLYNERTTTKAIEKDSSYGALNNIPEFTGTISFGQLNQGYDRSYEFTEYAYGIEVTRKLMDDDQSHTVDRFPKELGYSVQVTKETFAAMPFNYAFATQPSGLGGPLDSSGNPTELCASDQYDAGYGVNQSNEGTTAASAIAVEATRILMSDFKGDRGQIISVNPDMLLGPINTEEIFWEIINSKGKVDTANNNRNLHFGKYKLIIWKFLSDTNNWFMIDSRLIKDMLTWWDKVMEEFFQDKDSDTLVAKYATYMRFSDEANWRDWRFVYGHEVA